MSYDLMFQKAIELQNSGALNQAQDIYLKLLEVMPENSDVWNLLGLVAQSKGNLTQAEDCFLNAVKYAPIPFFAHFFNLALTYKALNKINEAVEAVQRSVTLKPDFKEGFNLLGVLEAGQMHQHKAVQAFCQALEIDNHYNEARANLCFYTKDVQTLRELAAKNKDDFYFQFLSAQAVDDLALREEYLRRAVTVAPERTDALLLLADSLCAQNKFEEGLKYYHKAFNLDENEIKACLGLADTYLNLKDDDKAEKYYLKSFNISRNFASAHINYGTLLYRQQRFAEALEEYRAALHLAPEKSEISYNLALILKETGDIEEALGLMFNAFLKEPENEIYAINIMETLSALFENNAETTFKIAQNWQKLAPDNLFSKRILAAFCGHADEKDNVSFAEKLFDNFAETYDATLERLHPNIINTFVKLNGPLKGNILDLGCGTGLAGVTLKNEENRFDGVDVSQQMLEIAKAKNVYDKLFHEDISSFLSHAKLNKYDMALAFDVFCYMGDLRAILLQLKGLPVWFSVESAEEDRADFYLTPSGRYKHKKSALICLLKDIGFKQIKDFDLVLRQENGKDVNGVLFFVK